MKFPMLLVCAFALIVVIIPIGVVTYNGEYTIQAQGSVNSKPPPSSSIQENMSKSPSVEDAVNISSISPVSSSSSTQTISTEKLSQMYNTNYFNILDITTGKINKVSVRDYVIGAVAAEMPPSFHTEALKAQAVAAHTYALRTRYDNLKNPNPDLLGADFSCDPSNLKGYMTEKSAKERYGDMFFTHWGKITEAVDSVLNIVLTYNGQPIVAAYHASSAGITEDAANVWVGSADYLKPVDSQGDILSPGYESHVTFTTDDFKKSINSHWSDAKFTGNPIDWMEIRERSEGGYVLVVDVGGIILHGKDVRNALGLRSSAFEITSSGDSITFTVYGYGHGVGLSQYGADYMARQGSDYIDILSHYYSKADVSLSDTKI